LEEIDTKHLAVDDIMGQGLDEEELFSQRSSIVERDNELRRTKNTK
jgi:hypothetical protein